MTKIIEVTEDDILNGVPRNNCNCPIARALKRHAGLDVDKKDYSIWELFVGSPIYSKTFKLKEKSYKVPRSAARFIRNFDRYKPVKPFRFKLVEVI